MEHFTTENWIDFVNQAVDARKKSLMEQHLKQGCKRCTETVSLWQRVQQSAASEASYQPPEDAVRIAKATFAGSGMADQRKGAGSRIKVLFDSFLQPVFEGARSAGTSTRQMLYRADPFQIDVQVEAKPGGTASWSPASFSTRAILESSVATLALFFLTCGDTSCTPSLIS